VGTQQPQEDFDGSWKVCTPETVGEFSAVGYFFGRTLNKALDVPIGLIDNSWGGSAAEAWVKRDLLANDDRYKALMGRWTEDEANAENQKAANDYDAQVAAWYEAKKEALKQGTAPPAHPNPPNNLLCGNARPGNLHNGVLQPVIGYGIRGAIWYQGESNAGRAYQYRHLFPLMIQSWRDEWGQGDFSFYWVQLADFLAETSEPQESAWAELREAQTMTLQLPKSGQAVIIDVGEGIDIHPRNKQDVGNRLARLALAQDYGVQIQSQSPRFKSLEIKGNKAVVTFDNVGGGLKAVDFKDPRGFAIAGEDHKFAWAQAQVVGPDRIEVWSDAVTAPVAVRYAWGDNPVVNLQSAEGLPVTPFRTDDWPGITATAE
jgi:sialate O-acetylesterase